MTTEERRLLDETMARLRALEEERAILRTLYRYGHSIDYGLQEQWLDCFTEDALYEYRYLGALTSLAASRSGTITDEQKRVTGGVNTTGTVEGDRVRWVGRAQLARFIALHTHAPDRYHKHMLVEPVVDIDGDEARAQSYFVRLDDSEGNLWMMAFGRYRDRLTRCPDGVWRMKERICDVEGLSALVPTAGPRADR